jgi:Kef-type K+ transport system membrane component KefB
MSTTAVPDAGIWPPGRRRVPQIAAYVGLVGAATVAVAVVLHLGHGQHAAHGALRRASSGAGGGSLDVGRLLLAVAAVLVATQLCGHLFRRLHQTHVVGEIVAGIALGPSVLGALSRSASRFLFPPSILPDLNVLAQIGLVLFMFLIGLEVDRWRLRRQAHATVVLSHVSIVLPFVLGVASALVLFSDFGGAGGFTAFSLFLGASMSVTAFPVLARILAERRLGGTPLGTTALACAAVDDITAWCLLAVVICVVRSQSPAAAVRTIVLSLLFVAVMLVVVRPLLERLVRGRGPGAGLGGAPLGVVFAGLLLSAMATDLIGIHAIFGAFLFGLIMPSRSDLVAELRDKLESITVLLLLPLFFAYTGMQTQIGLLGSSSHLWLCCLLILAVAVVGKWGGSAVAGRLLGMERRDAFALGALMNTRGLTELIILNVGLQIGAIPPVLFTMLVIMALVTTLMTGPALSRLFPQPSASHPRRELAGDQPHSP